MELFAVGASESGSVPSLYCRLSLYEDLVGGMLAVFTEGAGREVKVEGAISYLKRCLTMTR